MATDRSDSPERGILTEENLGVEDDEHVTRLGENRYLVSVRDEQDGHPAESPAPATTETNGSTPTPGLADVAAAYGVEIEAKTERGVDTFRCTSNDVTEVLEGLLRWYADQVGDGRPPEEVLEVLLTASDLDVDV